MAKKYVLKNITLNPARPVGLMVSAASKGINPQAHRMINTDDIPVTLEENEYLMCKDAINRYVDAKMLSLEVIGSDDKPEAEKAPESAPVDESNYADCEDKDVLEVFARTIDLEIDKRKGLDKIKAEIKAKLEEA